MKIWNCHSFLYSDSEKDKKTDRDSDRDRDNESHLVTKYSPETCNFSPNCKRGMSQIIYHKGMQEQPMVELEASTSKQKKECATQVLQQGKLKTRSKNLIDIPSALLYFAD